MEGNMTNRYIGITGFTSGIQIDRLLNRCPMDSDIDPKLMVGVLASSKTIRHQLTKYAKRYPKIEDIRNIFTEHAICLNLIHFHPESLDNLPDQMMEVIMMGGKYCHGLQLNAHWVSPEDLMTFRVFDSTSTIVLQVGKNAQEVYGNNPKLIGEKIKEYQGLVQYALIDPSGGKGEPMDLQKTEILLETFFEQGLQEAITFGIAGGISAEMIPQLAPLVKKFGVCIDAEGKLRNEDDEFLPEEAVRYVEESLKYLT